MTSHVEIDTRPKAHLSSGEWIKLGLITALVSIAAVLAVQALAIALWPEIALFAPLDNYARSALFTLIPVVGATFLLALAGSSAGASSPALHHDFRHRVAHQYHPGLHLARA